jgi:hypothetical protein
LQVLVKIRKKPESRTTSGSFAKDAEKESQINNGMDLVDAVAEEVETAGRRVSEVLTIAPILLPTSKL